LNIEAIDISILAPAFVAGLLVLVTHVPLGQEVLKRGIIFIDLAIAQIAGLGVVVATRLTGEAHGWEAQIIAVLSALIGAGLLSQMEKKWPQQQEALIGVTYALSATASILLLANNPQGGESLKDLLVGQILWVTWPQLALPALLSVVIFGAWLRFNRPTAFYPLFAVSVTVSVQLVGIYLVFASLIIPALATIGLKGWKALFVGFLLSASGYALGLLVSAMFDLPSGAVIVWNLATTCLVGRWLLTPNTSLPKTSR